MILKTNNILEYYIIPLAHKERICAIPLVQWRKEFVMV